MSKKVDNKVEILLPNTNIKAKFDPTRWNITADKDGFVTIENIRKKYGSKITDIKPDKITELYVNGIPKFLVEGMGQEGNIKGVAMYGAYEWFEDKFEFMDGTYRDRVTPINDYYYIITYNGKKTISDLNGGSASDFENVYFGDEITNIIGRKNVVIVEDPFKFDDNDEIEDTLIYGLELGSFRCVTPIWSKLQQRTIPLYTKEYIEAKKRIHRLYGAKQDDITIFFEVIETMNNLLQNYLPVEAPVEGIDYDKSTMVDDTVIDETGNLNEEFVKRLKINN